MAHSVGRSICRSSPPPPIKPINYFTQTTAIVWLINKLAHICGSAVSLSISIAPRSLALPSSLPPSIHPPHPMCHSRPSNKVEEIWRSLEDTRWRLNDEQQYWTYNTIKRRKPHNLTVMTVSGVVPTSLCIHPTPLCRYHETICMIYDSLINSRASSPLRRASNYQVNDLESELLQFGPLRAT